jgi:hypothetical protein
MRNLETGDTKVCSQNLVTNVSSLRRINHTLNGVFSALGYLVPYGI